jgi:hypothetical protein
MQTKLLMSVSALFMAGLGVTASFLPQEIATHFGMRPDPIIVLLIQITGALYLAFAILNWMARSVLIGGIYSRPLALANFLQFVVITTIFLKALVAGFRPHELIVGAVIYFVFAVWFGRVLFTHPSTSR